MPGSGKTTVGKRLAKTMGIPFADTDQLIEADQGCSIPDIFSTRGEDYFRDVEERIQQRVEFADIEVADRHGVHGGNVDRRPCPVGSESQRVRRGLSLPGSVSRP